MGPKKYRWSKTYEAGEGELIDLLAAKKIDAERWTTSEFEEIETHPHSYDTTIWCAEGSIAYTINKQTFPLQAGDALFIPANYIHGATTGFAGSICYETSQQGK